MDGSPPGSSVHGIFQARIWEWVAISCSRGPSWPRDWTHISFIPCTGRRFLPLCHLGRFYIYIHTQTHTYIYIYSCCSVVSNSLWPHGLLHARFPCPSSSCSNSCPLSWWCHPIVSSSINFFSCLQSFPASGSFLKSQLFASGIQSIEASSSALVLPVKIQNWFPLELTVVISFQLV